MNPSLFLFVFAVQFASYFVKGIAGFGDALVASPLLSLQMENRTISPLSLLMSLPANGVMLYKNRRAVQPKLVLPMVAAVLCGVVPGTLLLRYAASRGLKMLLGALVAGVGLQMLLQKPQQSTKPPGKWAMLAVSFATGVTAGMFSISVFLVAYIKRTTQGRSALRGNVCFVFFAENLFRLAAYAVGGLFSAEVLWLLLPSFPGMALGLFCAARLDARLSEKAIHYTVVVVFLLSGLSGLLRAAFAG